MPTLLEIHCRMKMYLTPKTYCLAVAMALSFVSCKKEPIDTLPPATHKGKNTFGCLIDGEPFIAGTNSSFAGPTDVWADYNESTHYFQIQADREDESGNLDIVRFQCYAINGVGSYTVYATISDVEGYVDYSGGSCEYYHDTTNLWKVEINYINKQKRYISGEFNMTLINNNCNANKKMIITDGRFDITYH